MATLEKAVPSRKVVSPMEAAAAAKCAGYCTTPETFVIQVATALAKADGFRKVGREQYERLATRATAAS